MIGQAKREMDEEVQDNEKVAPSSLDLQFYESENDHGPNAASGSLPSTTPSISPANSRSDVSTASTLVYENTYYIHSWDGKLLAEYNNLGQCVKDYIYLGNRLIAEYQPRTGNYYYYTPDQIGTTRLVTNSSGAVVYAAANDPFGGIQKVWANTMDPNPKFSGKERELRSELDYFGARYYDHRNYRFNSVDPIINKDEAINKLQMWNLYAYCRNNPITYSDPDGKESMCGESRLYAQGKNAEIVGTLIREHPVVSAALAVAGLSAPLVSPAMAAIAAWLAPTVPAIHEGYIGLSKADARAVINELGLAANQTVSALRFVKDATTSTTISILNQGKVLIIQLMRKGIDGYQVMQSNISSDGTKKVIQCAYDAAGKLVHTHLK
jgi:RHS repeat-associated protein